MLPQIFFSQSAWDLACAEMEKYAPKKEVPIAPLSYLHYWPYLLKSPLQRYTTLEDISYIVVPWVIHIPKEVWDSSNISIDVTDGFNPTIQQEVIEAIQRFPLLWNSDWLHSHPFAKKETGPSPTDITKHMKPHRNLNRKTNLDMMVSMIGVRPKKNNWKIQCFSLDKDDKVIDLGFAQVLPDDDRKVMQCFARPFYAGKTGRRWLKRQLRQLNNRGYIMKKDPLARGWLRIIVEVSLSKKFILAFPPHFPKAAPKVIHWQTKPESILKLINTNMPNALMINDWQLPKLITTLKKEV